MVVNNCGRKLMANWTCKKWVVDSALIIMGANPFELPPTADLTLKQVFVRCGHSLLVASALFKDRERLQASREKKAKHQRRGQLL